MKHPPIPFADIIVRCDDVVKTPIDGAKIPKNLLPEGYELTPGVKLLLINSFLTVLANFGDITEEEFKVLLLMYRTKLLPVKTGAPV